MVETNQTSGFWPSLYAPLRGVGSRIADWLSPASDASSDEDAYRISMELPGVSETDINVTAEAGTLVVSGEKSSEREDKGDTWYFSERQYGSFRRSFRLPADADDGGIVAHMKDGVLEISVPRKKPDTGSAKSIPVRKA
ncbi:Hsp20/alpha crystallin family protein [Marivita geojedonensis]|uniref:Glutamyl-tRNA amidotransferase n=1 Tax=Marivita geojedonensis TaxID=1123756 RepID=A0A1X4NNI3_9RHOB|nr:Hsp20/alpha crystallin family protein [Marivita geojedonensis]OSQ52080.1 glutamyl-tRNA amidotransferase [Marivita geojedonensis]PRY81155.1 heat shock protein Hsp20 [Marivita geojedonensis]